jgi:hypothetical protein
MEDDVIRDYGRVEVLANPASHEDVFERAGLRIPGCRVLIEMAATPDGVV